MKNIKVKIIPPVRAVSVYLALVEMGYHCESEGVRADITNNTATWLYGNDSTLIGSVDEEDTSGELYEEHYYINGKLVPVDEYYTYPTTQYSLDRDDKTTYEPLPDEANVPSITPRVEFLRARVTELLSAMLKFNEMKLVPPSEWHLELEDLFEEIKNA